MKNVIGSIGKRNRGQSPTDVLLAFVQSANMHGRDELTVCSGAIDILRAYIGDRPCCVWKNVNPGLTKVCERGMVEIFYKKDLDNNQNALARTLVSGNAEFDACRVETITPEISSRFDGFLNVPIKLQEDMKGILSVAVTKRESRDRTFVQPLECLGRLLALVLQNQSEQEKSENKERKLRAELDATTRELAQTNNRLIERVRELKTMSKELEKRVEELTQLSKAKDEFLSIVSHELRTPLTSLKGFLCVLLDEEAGSITEAQRKFLNIAKQSADRLNVLISDLLDISRIESGRLNLDMNVCSLYEIVAKSVEGLKSSAQEKEIQMSFEAQPNLPDIWGDSHRLLQVIDNLLTNAIKFTPHGGSIKVCADLQQDAVRVSVQDSGPGIDEEELKKIFDMFYQVDASTRRATGGAGLGLAISNGIVNMHGGRIWVQSQVGKGSTFFFEIPKHQAQKAA